MRMIDVVKHLCDYDTDGIVFKQKTAYEMRNSDWSSDACSSDLAAPHRRPHRSRTGRRTRHPPRAYHDRRNALYTGRTRQAPAASLHLPGPGRIFLMTLSLHTEFSAPDHVVVQVGGRLDATIGRASCRGRVCQYV